MNNQVKNGTHVEIQEISDDEIEDLELPRRAPESRPTTLPKEDQLDRSAIGPVSPRGPLVKKDLKTPPPEAEVNPFLYLSDDDDDKHGEKGDVSSQIDYHVQGGSGSKSRTGQSQQSSKKSSTVARQKKRFPSKETQRGHRRCSHDFDVRTGPGSDLDSSEPFTEDYSEESGSDLDSETFTEDYSEESGSDLGSEIGSDLGSEIGSDLGSESEFEDHVDWARSKQASLFEFDQVRLKREKLKVLKTKVEIRTQLTTAAKSMYQELNLTNPLVASLLSGNVKVFTFLMEQRMQCVLQCTNECIAIAVSYPDEEKSLIFTQYLFGALKGCTGDPTYAHLQCLECAHKRLSEDNQLL